MFSETVDSSVSKEERGIERSFDKMDREVEDVLVTSAEISVAGISESELKSRRDGEFQALEEAVSPDATSSLSCELNDGLVSDRDEFSRVQENESHCGSVGSPVVEPMAFTESSEVERGMRGPNASHLGCDKRVDGEMEMTSATIENVGYNDDGDMIMEQPGEVCLKEDESRCKPHSPLTDHETLSSMLESSCERGSAAIDRSATSLDNDVLAIPTIEGMDSDDFNEQFCFSVEELQESPKAINGCAENQNNAIADHFGPYQLNQIVADQDDLDGNVLPNAESGRGSIIGQQSFEIHCDSAQVSNIKSNGKRNHRQPLEVVEFNEVVELDSKGSNGLTTLSGSEMKTYSRMTLKNRVLPLMFVNSDVSDKMEGCIPVRVESEWDERIKFDDRVALAEHDPSTGDYGYQEHTGIMMHAPMLNNQETSTMKFRNDNHTDWDQEGENIVPGDVSDFNPCIKRVSDMEHRGYCENDASRECSEMESQTHCSGSGKASFNEEHSDFSVSDLVWGKVRSHPWWPGQIFNASDASEKAMKYYKSDCFLVAYFGDRTFAWNEASLLKPFRSHFSHVEKQSNSEAFQNAVVCALDEVARRVDLGLACSCVPKEELEIIKYQIVENTGIQPESSTREVRDNRLGIDLFDPKQLTEQIKSLALCPSNGTDRLDLVIARSQLQAFSRFQGFSNLREYVSFEDSDGLQFENEIHEHSSLSGLGDAHISYGEVSSEQRNSYHKRKHNLKDGNYVRKKGKITFDSINESWDSFGDEIDLVSPSGKKKIGVEPSVDEYSDSKKSISVGRIASIPKPSFKIGECIRRVASQMTGSPSILKTNIQKADGICGGIVDVSESSSQIPPESETKNIAPLPEYSSVNDLLAHFYFLTEHPYRKHNLSSTLTGFFFNFRNSVIINPNDKDGRMKEVPYLGGSPETFEFEDMSDTYWTDRVIQNGSEDQPSRRGRKRLNQPVPSDADKRYRRSTSKKQQSLANGDMLSDKPVDYVDENSPAELVMHFPVVDSVPSESNLSRMFKRFGPLKESDTEVDRDTNRARVVFKKSSDAEAAYSSASKFNIFGQTLVNYQLNYTISVPFKSPTLMASLGDEDVTLFLEY